MSNLGNKEIMAKNILHYIELKGISKSRICEDLNFPMSSFSDWIHARTYPRIDKIEAMAKYLGITKADLVEEKTEVSSSAIRSAMLVKKFESLSERDKQVIEKMIDSIID